MPRDRDADKLRPDVNQTAYATVLAAIGEGPKPQPPSERTTKNLEAVKRGRKGGKRGGKARAKALTASRRRAIARRAGKAPRKHRT